MKADGIGAPVITIMLASNPSILKTMSIIAVANPVKAPATRATASANSGLCPPVISMAKAAPAYREGTVHGKVDKTQDPECEKNGDSRQRIR